MGNYLPWCLMLLSVVLMMMLPHRCHTPSSFDCFRQELWENRHRLRSS